MLQALNHISSRFVTLLEKISKWKDWGLIE